MFEKIRDEFFNKNKIPLEEAIARYNKKGNAIDIDFLKTTLEDKDFQSIALEQIKEIEDSLSDLLSVRDNFMERILMKTIEDVAIPKKINDDTRLSTRIIDRELVIQNILNSPYQVNPLHEINSYTVKSEKIIPVFFFNTQFFKTNKEHIIINRTPSWKMTSFIIPEQNVKKLFISREMIDSLDLRQYPFVIRWEIMKNNFGILAI